MKGKIFPLLMTMIAVAALVFVMSGCGSEDKATDGGDNAAADYKIRIGHSDTEDNLLNTSLKDYAKWVSEETDGKVQIKIYPNEKLGDNSVMAQQLVTGELDAMMMPQGVEAKYAPKIATLGLPFLFSNYEQAWAVMDDEEIAAGLTEGLKDYNLVQLAFWENGMRQITDSKRKINDSKDVKGLSIRIPDDDMTAMIFKEMGAKTTVFSWTKTYDALKQGTFDGQENPVANIYANSIQEVNKYMTLTNHKYESKNLVFSLSTWKELPEDIKSTLKKGAKKFGKEHRKAVAGEEKEQIKKLKESGMEINEDPDIQAFKVATRDVYRQFETQNEWTSELVSKIRKAASKK